MASFVKPGGLACISFREKNLESEKLGYKQKPEEMQVNCVWEEISRILDDYLMFDESDVKGYYIIFKVFSVLGNTVATEWEMVKCISIPWVFPTKLV